MGDKREGGIEAEEQGERDKREGSENNAGAWEHHGSDNGLKGNEFLGYERWKRLPSLDV